MFGLMRTNQIRPVYDPFWEMDALEKAFFSEDLSSFFHPASAAVFPTDITDEGDHYVLQTDLPGFDKKDISLQLQEDTLTIRAERRTKHRHKDDQGKAVRLERGYGAYQRSFDISGIDADKIKAKYTDGVLRLTLPKLEDPAPKVRHLQID